jgi:hypothetical protein
LDVSASNLAERYGRTKRDNRRTRFWAIATAAFIVVVFAAWAIWAGLFQPTASIESTTTGTVRVSDDTLRVKWEVSVSPGATAQCALEALNESFAVVGWKIIDIPASDKRSRTFERELLTSEPATSGLNYSCWLT